MGLGNPPSLHTQGGSAGLWHIRVHYTQDAAPDPEGLMAHVGLSMSEAATALGGCLPLALRTPWGGAGRGCVGVQDRAERVRMSTGVKGLGCA